MRYAIIALFLPIFGGMPPGVVLLRYSLTVPDHFHDLQRMRAAARTCAEDLAKLQPGVTGAWLVLDVSKEGRLHLYGVGLAPVQNMRGLMNQWRSLTGADYNGCLTDPVTGAAGYLKEIQRQGYCGRAALGKLQLNLGGTQERVGVIGYTFKPLSAALSTKYSYLERALAASGPFDAIWAKTVHDFKLCAPVRRPSRKKAVKNETCVTCRKRLAAGRRSHMRSCSARCRKKLAERRRSHMTCCGCRKGWDNPWHSPYQPHLVQDPALRRQLVRRLRPFQRYLRAEGAIDVLEQIGTARSDEEAERQLILLVAERVLRVCPRADAQEVCYELAHRPD